MPRSQTSHNRVATQSDHSDFVSWLSKSQFISPDLIRQLPARINFGSNLLNEFSDQAKSEWFQPNQPNSLGSLSAGILSLGSPAQFLDSEQTDRCCFWVPGTSSIDDRWLNRKSICVSSSRLSRKLDAYDSWFDAIRTMAARLDPNDHVFLTGAKTTTDTFIRRIGQLFGFPLLDFRPFPKNVTRKWILGCLQEASDQSTKNPNHVTCYFSSLPTNDATRTALGISSTDQIVIALAQELRLLSVRKNGNIYDATLKRLAESQSEPAAVSTKLLIDSRLTNEAVKSELVSRGATAWWLYNESEDEHLSALPTSGSGFRCSHSQQKANADFQSNSPQRKPFNVPILELSEIQPDRFLLHWTRRRVGAWPDQTQHEYLDDLIFRSSRRNHDNLSSVARILASRKLIASNQLTRDCNPVVCFSNLPLTELAERTVFRKHLGRWDFQPFGIAIERDLLMEVGAKPVMYGEQQDWDRMPTEDRPFFQLSVSGGSQIDWRQEQEWRLLGNLDLNLVGNNSAVVFVNTAMEAEAIAPISRWPIVILGAPESSPA